MSHDFFGLTTKEPLNIEKDNLLCLNQRLTDDISSCIKQLRSLQRKSRDSETEEEKFFCEEPRKLVKVNLWVNDEELNEKRVTELETLRSFIINPLAFGQDNNSGTLKKLQIDISATSNSNLIQPFEIPEIHKLNGNSDQNHGLQIDSIESCHNNMINVPKFSRIKSKRMKMIEQSTVLKKGKVFSIKYLQKQQ